MNINFSALEIGLSNSCFLVLLLTTIYYWIKIIVFSTNNPQYENKGLLGIITADILITIQLILRWVDSGHFPLSNLYESLLFLSWGLLIFYIFIEKFTKIEFLGLLISPVILCLIAFTGFSLPPELQESRPLVPALQSNWLFMHVSVMMLSYAALLLGCLFSISYLVFYFYQNFTKGNPPINWGSQVKQAQIKPANPLAFESNISTNSTLPSENTLETTFTILELLDNLSYRTLGMGFCFLTLGILSGAVWANETWGSYWSWDPKETWALITWLIFAVYLHTRFIKGWDGVKPAWIASFGFLIIWVCYLGVNLLGKGLHSYGFLNS